MSSSLNNTEDIIANSIYLIQGNDIIDILDLISNATGGLENNTYTKSQIDSFLNLKRNLIDSYSIIQTNNLLNNKLDVSVFNTEIALKSNITDVFQKQIVDNETFMILNNKFRYKITNNKVILQFFDEAGTLITNTWIDVLSFNVDDNLNQITFSNIYNKNETDQKIADIVNSAPETLNTLNELAAALGNDPNFATTISNQIGLKANQATTYTKVQT